MTSYFTSCRLKYSYLLIVKIHFHISLNWHTMNILKSHMISMHIFSCQNHSIFYNTYFEGIEDGVSRREQITFSTHYVVILEKCEIVFKLLTSNCIFEMCQLNVNTVFIAMKIHLSPDNNNFVFAKIITLPGIFFLSFLMERSSPLFCYCFKASKRSYFNL